MTPDERRDFESGPGYTRAARLARTPVRRPSIYNGCPTPGCDGTYPHGMSPIDVYHEAGHFDFRCVTCGIVTEYEWPPRP